VGGASEGDMWLCSNYILWMRLNILNLISDIFKCLRLKLSGKIYFVWFRFFNVVFGLFRKIAGKRATIFFVMSVRPSVLMERLGSHWTDFHEILYLVIFRKSVGENSSFINI
jgi:hypothetical protein